VFNEEVVFVPSVPSCDAAIFSRTSQCCGDDDDDEFYLRGMRLYTWVYGCILPQISQQSNMPEDKSEPKESIE
jgi:hypothetical protein